MIEATIFVIKRWKRRGQNRLFSTSELFLLSESFLKRARVIAEKTVAQTAWPVIEQIQRRTIVGTLDIRLLMSIIEYNKDKNEEF